MVQVEVSGIIHAPKEKVYATQVAFQNWPKIFPWVKSVRLVSEQGNERVIESVLIPKEGKKKERVFRNIQRFVSPNQIDEFQRPISIMDGLPIMMRFSFETVPDGTRILITVSLGGPNVKYNFLFKAAAFLFRERIGAGLDEAFQRSLELKKKYIESGEQS